MMTTNPKKDFYQYGREPASHKRPKRVADLIKNEIAMLLLHKVKDPRLVNVAIVSAEVTRDLRKAIIYYSVLGDEEKTKKAAAGLARAADEDSGAVAHGAGHADLRCDGRDDVRHAHDDGDGGHAQDGPAHETHLLIMRRTYTAKKFKGIDHATTCCSRSDLTVPAHRLRTGQRRSRQVAGSQPNRTNRIAG